VRLPEAVTAGRGSLHILMDHLPAPGARWQPKLLLPVCAGPLLKVAEQ
jgi:hypothetical protein